MILDMRATSTAAGRIRIGRSSRPSQRGVRSARGGQSSWGTVLAISAVLAFVACFVRIGADAYWLVALGDHILSGGGTGHGLPFAAASTSGWANVVVVAEILLAVIGMAGSHALLVAQLVLDGVALYLLGDGARWLGASDRRTALSLMLVSLGSLPALVVVRAQMLSFIPFVALLLLLRAEHRRPSQRIWLVVPLLVVWSNLHGAVLMGVAVAGCYVLISRLKTRPREAILLGAAALGAPLVTPAWGHTVGYYHGVLSNEAARRGSDLWAAPSLTDPFDVLMILSAVTLLAMVSRARPPLWEGIALLGLAIGTVMAARHGVWLLMMAAGLAAAGRRRDADIEPASLLCRPAALGWRQAAVLVLFSAAMAGPILALRGTAPLPAAPRTVAALVALADGRTMLAPEPLVESLAADGALVWASDPVDAFSPAVQDMLLDYYAGDPDGPRALAQVALAVVDPGSHQDRWLSIDANFTRGPDIDGWRTYERR